MLVVTQQQIADALKISRETVTKALQDHPKVCSKTKDKVRALADEMGYIPNFTARNLSSKKTRTIGVIVPKISHSFFSSVLELMYKTVRKFGYNLIPMVSFEEKQNEIKNIKTLLSMRVDGIIANISQDTTDHDIYLELKKHGIPVVFFDRVVESDFFSTVTTDDRKASYEIMSYALSKGYRKPAHLAGYVNINIGRERRQGFLDALESFKITPNPSWIIEGGFSEETRSGNARHLLSSDDRPDLIFAFNDSIAKCVYDAADMFKIKIPDELGVIGFGNLEFGSILNPKLSTVALPLQTIADESVRLIIDHVEKKEGNTIKHINLTPEIIIRESCR
jgi:LacI family transcriptional regulator